MMQPYTIPWTIFIFCYNEEHTVGKVIDLAVDVCTQLSQNQCEILVVNDGSTDRSQEVIDVKCGQYNNVKAIHHSTNKGIGAALISGYSNAKGERVCGIPADGQFNPEEIIPYGNLEAGEVISFVRKDKRYTNYRVLLSSFNNLTNKFLLGLSLQDVNWVKIYHAKDLKAIHPTLKSSLVESEMCAMLKVHGVSFREVPSFYYQREVGETKGGSLKTVSKAAFELVALLWRVNRFRFRNRCKSYFNRRKVPITKASNPLP
ncbi:MAG: glycosyltransferase family 2 protein [Flavobacteriales bacterium]|nr:glycosyltransferase family 2 protein [Flavobacteriales bacterium]